MNTFKLNGDITENNQNLKESKSKIDDTKNSTENECSLFLTCFKRLLIKIKFKVSKKFFYYSFEIKLMILFVPAIIILGILLIMTHCIEYKEKFVLDYLEVYESLILKKENTDIKFNEYEIKETIDNSFQNLIFMKIYAREMIRKNFLIDEVYLNHTNYVYSNLFLQNEDDYFISTIMNYTIDFNDICGICEKEFSRKTKTEHNMKFNNLIKNFILFSPLLLQNDYFHNLNPSHIYFMISSFSKDSYGDNLEYSYYPKRNGIYSKSMFFDPFPTEDNWFYSFHHEFIQSESIRSRLKLSTSYKDIAQIGLEKSEEYIPILQSKIVHEDSTIILEIVSKYTMHISSKKGYEAFSFINLFNNLTQITNTPVQRFVDNRIVIGNTPITPISIPKIYQIYYRKGMVPFDKNLQIFGYNSDINDFTSYINIDEKYKLSLITELDSLPYLMMYFYNSFYLKILEENIKFDEKDSSFDRFIQIIPPIYENSRSIISQVCNSFNITHYLFNHYMIYHDINCLAEDHINTYKMFNELLFRENQEFIYDEENVSSVPHCKCLLFYCFDLNDKDNPIFSLENSLTFNEFREFQENFIYADRIFLPKKCSLSFKNYKKSLLSTIPNSFDLEFHMDKNGLIFNPNMSHISTYIISNYDFQYSKDNFTSELKTLILQLITIYSITLICFFIFFLFYVFRRFNFIKNTIKEYLFNFDINEDEIYENILEKSDKKNFESELDKTEKKTSILIPRNSSINFHNNAIINLGFEDKNISLKASNIKIFDKKRESRLDIIKENVEIENDESVFVDKKNFSSKKTLHLQEAIIEKCDKSINNTLCKNEELNIHIIPNYSNKIKTIPNDEVIQELIFTNNSYNSINENDLNSSIIQSEFTKSINTHDEHMKKIIPLLIQSEKISINKINAKNKLNIIKAIKQIKIDDSFYFINLDSFFLKLGEEDVDKSLYEDEYLIKKFDKIFYKNKKFLCLMNKDVEDLDEESFKIKKNSKSLLTEIISTEFCNFDDMSFNFGFKYEDNENSLFDELNLKFKNEEMKSISLVDEYIDNIEMKLKLKEKFNITNQLSFYFEAEINSDEEIEYSGNDILKFNHIKSIVYYYLENILLSGLKKIYVENYKDYFE